MKYILMLVAILISTPAFSGWTSSVNISDIIAEGNDSGSGFLIQFASSVGSTEGGACTGTYHYLNASTEKGKMLFSMFLSARVSGEAVRVTLIDSGSSNRCSIIGVRY